MTMEMKVASNYLYFNPQRLRAIDNLASCINGALYHPPLFLDHNSYNCYRIWW